LAAFYKTRGACPINDNPRKIQPFFELQLVYLRRQLTLIKEKELAKK